MSETITSSNGIQVDVDQIERAAKALAVADCKNWKDSDVRNRYRGLALTTVSTYLAPVDPVRDLLEH